MSALDDIAAERIRQLDEKGYDADHDDGHETGAIAVGAAHFALLPDDLDRLGVLHGDLWPAELGPIPKPLPRRDELVRGAAMLAAEIDRLDRGRAGVPQAYLPSGVCWQRRPIQCAVMVRVEVIRFVGRHPGLRVFSGLRVGSSGDHRCGYATDLVPDDGDRATIAAAYRDAENLVAAGHAAYVEPLSATWIPGNHHLHISWKRCP